MTKIITEKLSSLMDNELDDHDISEIVKRCKEDKGLFTYWMNCHLISGVLKNNLPDPIHTDFAKRVSLALQNESSHQKTENNVVPFFKTSKGISRFAIAASFSALTVVALMQVNQVMENDSMRMAAQTEENKQAIVAENKAGDEIKENIQNNVYVTTQTSKQGNDFQVNDPDLQRFMVDYNQFLVTAPSHVPLLPHTKTVNYEGKE